MNLDMHPYLYYESFIETDEVLQTVLYVLKYTGE